MFYFLQRTDLKHNFSFSHPQKQYYVIVGLGKRLFTVAEKGKYNEIFIPI